jgi:hypothetical protein
LTLCDQELSLQFRQRSARVTQKMQELPVVEVRLSLGDVAGNRDRGSPDLISETVDFPFLETDPSTHKRD